MSQDSEDKTRRVWKPEDDEHEDCIVVDFISEAGKTLG